MASELMDKLKETLQPTGEESHGVSLDSNQHHERREPALDTGNETYTSRSEEQRSRQPEGVRTGDRIESLVENVPGVPSSHSKPSIDDREQASRAPQDPGNAAHVPPSALRQHIGEPSIEHEYPHDSSTQRHTSVSHQEAHYNLG
ncbi:hypothetical protein FZEAL_6202 [Fusarium zealandicum]|uniref:Uncharacterized protein n=1 Tax=Fusarium zealandicum TaxID=1053134 RepID=A0A8H4UIH8_9HYPO|nr:hypothetical protein FZEAL_6202 [Fusarium zealandicum]